MTYEKYLNASSPFGSQFGGKTPQQQWEETQKQAYANEHNHHIALLRKFMALYNTWADATDAHDKAAESDAVFALIDFSEEVRHELIRLGFDPMEEPSEGTEKAQ
jgi:hypothetical protein